jgi:ferredoxin-NADP reductase
VGPRSQAPLNKSTLWRLVPDIAGRDVYLCGPDEFMRALKNPIRELGVPRQRIHRESFAF